MPSKSGIKFIKLSAIIALSSCAPELAGHTANIGLALTQVEQGNIYRNIAISFQNPNFIPIPYILQEGTATLNDEISTGASPSISLVGRAISGFKLDAGLTFQRTFKIKPQDGISNRLRARALFRHAICNPRPFDGCPVLTLEREFKRLGSVGSRGQAVSSSDGLTEAIKTLVGSLPPGPFIFRDAECAGRSVHDYVDGRVYCFQDQWALAQFTVWLASVTQEATLPDEASPAPTSPRSAGRQRTRPAPGAPTPAPSPAPSSAPRGGRLEQRDNRSSGTTVEPLINRSFR